MQTKILLLFAATFTLLNLVIILCVIDVSDIKLLYVRNAALCTLAVLALIGAWIGTKTALLKLMECTINKAFDNVDIA